MCPARAVDFPVGDSDWGARGGPERAEFANHWDRDGGGRCKNVDTGCGRALRHDVSARGSCALIDVLRLAFFRVDMRPLWLSNASSVVFWLYLDGRAGNDVTHGSP